MRRTPDWNAILAVAKEAESQLDECPRRGRQMRGIYWSSFRRACALGYRGTNGDWQTFVRARGSDEVRRVPA